MNGRYAIIGWGSLIWDLEILTPHVELPWQMSAGPRLPMEFSRVSVKRKMGLAVCLDVGSGDDCPTHIVPSRRETLSEAVADLAARERAPIERIGGVCLTSGAQQGRQHFTQVVRDWCRSHHWQGAVWTDLESNFLEMREMPFSVPVAIEYLKTLRGEQQEEAVRYITNAPKATNTPLRRALEQQAWWCDLAKGYGLSIQRPVNSDLSIT